MKTIRISCGISAPGISAAVHSNAGSISASLEAEETSSRIITDTGDFLIDNEDDYIVFNDASEEAQKVSGELKENDRIRIIYGESE